jgi:hypothetical protein
MNDPYAALRIAQERVRRGEEHVLESELMQETRAINMVDDIEARRIRLAKLVTELIPHLDEPMYVSALRDVFADTTTAELAPNALMNAIYLMPKPSSELLDVFFLIASCHPSLDLTPTSIGNKCVGYIQDELHPERGLSSIKALYQCIGNVYKLPASILPDLFRLLERRPDEDTQELILLCVREYIVDVDTSESLGPYIFQLLDLGSSATPLICGTIGDLLVGMTEFVDLDSEFHLALGPYIDRLLSDTKSHNAAQTAMTLIAHVYSENPKTTMVEKAFARLNKEPRTLHVADTLVLFSKLVSNEKDIRPVARYMLHIIILFSYPEWVDASLDLVLQMARRSQIYAIFKRYNGMEALLPLTSDPKQTTRLLAQSVVRALVYGMEKIDVSTEAFIPTTMQLLKDSDAAIRYEAVTTLTNIARLRPDLVMVAFDFMVGAWFESSDAKTRRAAAVYLKNVSLMEEEMPLQQHIHDEASRRASEVKLRDTDGNVTIQSVTKSISDHLPILQHRIPLWHQEITKGQYVITKIKAPAALLLYAVSDEIPPTMVGSDDLRTLATKYKLPHLISLVNKTSFPSSWEKDMDRFMKSPGDFTFIVGNERVAAHRCLLNLRSKTCREHKGKEMSFKWSKDMLGAMLRYVYMGTITDVDTLKTSPSLLIQLLDVAMHFQLAGLQLQLEWMAINVIRKTGIYQWMPCTSPLVRLYCFYSACKQSIPLDVNEYPEYHTLVEKWVDPSHVLRI